MKKMINKTHVEGRIAEHNLELRTSQKGVQYIGGKLVVATDEAGLNTIPVEIIYVTATNKNGSPNKTYETLSNIINNGKTILNDGIANATMVRLDSSVGLNEWYKDENGEKTLVSAKRIAGGFAHLTQTLNADEGARNTFECDMVITGTVFFEGDEEKGTQDKLVVKGCTFDFSGKVLPVEFSVTNPNGIKYFENNLDATPNTPVFTKVWGKMINETIITKNVEESAFGEAVVKEVKREKRDWVITGMSKDAYEFDTEGVLTAKELQDAMANRNIYLADLLQKQIERENAKKNNNNAFGATAPAASAPAAGGFNF